VEVMITGSKAAIVAGMYDIFNNLRDKNDFIPISVASELPTYGDMRNMAERCILEADFTGHKSDLDELASLIHDFDLMVIE